MDGWMDGCCRCSWSSTQICNILIEKLLMNKVVHSKNILLWQERSAYNKTMELDDWELLSRFLQFLCVLVGCMHRTNTISYVLDFGVALVCLKTQVPPFVMQHVHRKWADVGWHFTGCHLFEENSRIRTANGLGPNWMKDRTWGLLWQLRRK